MEVNYDFFSEILPPECSQLIFSFLTPIDVVNASQVSKTFFNLIDSRGIWKKAVEYQFGKLNKDHIRQVQQNLLKINWRVMFNHSNTVAKWLRYFHSPKYARVDVNSSPLVAKSGRVCQATADSVFVVYANEKKKSPVGKIFGLNPPFYDEVVGISDNAVVMHNTSMRHVTVCNLTVDCKHSNEKKWKSSPNHLLPCKEQCSQVVIKSVHDCYFHKLSETTLILTNDGINAVKSNGTIEQTLINFSKCKTTFSNYRYVHRRNISEARNLTRDGKTNLIAIVLIESGYVIVNLTEQKILRILDGCKLTWFSKSSHVAILRDNAVFVTDFWNESGPVQKVVDVKQFPGATSIEDVTATKEGEYNLILNIFHKSYITLVNLMWPIGLTLGEHMIEGTNKYWPMFRMKFSDPSHLILSDTTALKFSQPLKFT